MSAVPARLQPSGTRFDQARQVTLLDLLDRLLDGGIVIHGEITLAVADVDLVNLGLRLTVGSVHTLRRDTLRRDTLRRDLRGQVQAVEPQ